MALSSLKIASALIGIGGIATGAGIGIYKMLNNSGVNKKTKKKISALLKGKSILDKNGNDKKWLKNWNKFKEDYESKLAKSNWVFAETSTLSSVSSAPENFKNNCHGKKEFLVYEDDKVIEEVIAYCTDNGE